MKQINLNVTPEFERDLKTYMRRRGLKNKSDAIRTALREAVAIRSRKPFDFTTWLGMGLKSPLNPRPRFTSEDDLWS